MNTIKEESSSVQASRDIDVPRYMEGVSHCFWKWNLCLETMAKWKAPQKATLKFVINNYLAANNPYFLGGIWLPPRAPHPHVAHPTYLVMAKPLTATLIKLANHSCFLGRLAVWSLWGWWTAGVKPGVCRAQGRRLLSVPRPENTSWWGPPTQVCTCSHTDNYVALVTCPNFSRLPSLYNMSHFHSDLIELL